MEVINFISSRIPPEVGTAHYFTTLPSTGTFPKRCFSTVTDKITRYQTFLDLQVAVYSLNWTRTRHVTEKYSQRMLNVVCR